ncbi:MAG: hypothetical protein HYT82_01810 [Candidatus Harrisonbacteria bacterium]|nr:hypothetical protein [Candidatus Harrisonbacteria bacterium]MBI2406376.1 hypothetical protein [Candidatus Harrisonbacteria bacterium]MBI2603981.1 hypothetical protein [Candidatus Harrisonbacteria bacterium]
MTIIEPNKTQRGVRIVFAGSIVALIGVALWSIVLYNRTVNMAHEISAYERAYNAMLVKNGELKHTLYALTDVKNLRRVAANLGLVPMRHLEYIEEDRAPALASAAQR